MQRRTAQREAILKALERADRPLSPQEILRNARRRSPGLGIATVYRSVKAMLEAGVIQTVELPGMPDRYETADRRHHHHFHCRECDKVFEVDKCPGDMRKLAPRGFAVESHDITLYGLCPDCR